jgi:hypothetical protein
MFKEFPVPHDAGVVHGVEESHFLQCLATTLGAELGKVHFLHNADKVATTTPKKKNKQKQDKREQVRSLSISLALCVVRAGSASLVTQYSRLQ